MLPLHHNFKSLFCLAICFCVHAPFQTVAARSTLIYAWDFTGTRPNISDSHALRAGNASHNSPLIGNCEGACENSAICKIGLTCFNRGTEWSLVPGCDGVGVRGQRYCHNGSSSTTYTPQAERTATIPDAVGEATIAATATVNDASLTESIGTRHDALVTMSAPVTFGGEFAIVVVVKPTSLVRARNAGGWDDPFAETSKGTSLFWCAPSVEEDPTTLLNDVSSSWSSKDVSAGFSGPRSWGSQTHSFGPQEWMSNAQFSFSLGERTTASPYRGNDFGTIDATSELLSDMDNDGEGWPRAIHLIFAAGPTARVYVDGVAGEVTRATAEELKAIVPIVPRSCRLGHSFASPTHVFVESFAIYQGAMSKAEAATIYKRWMCDPKRESERETRGIYSRTTPANCVVPPSAVLLHSWDFTKPTSAVRVVDKVSAAEAVLVNVYADTQGRGLDFRVDPNTADPLAKYATFEVDLGGEATSIEVCATFDSDTASSLVSCSDTIAPGSTEVDNWFTMQRELAAGSTSFEGDEIYYNKHAFACKPDGTERSVYYSNQPGFYYGPNKSYVANTTNPGADATSRVKACADACTSRKVPPATALAFKGAALEDCEGAAARYLYMAPPPSGNVELAEIIVAGPTGVNYTIMDGAVGKETTQDAGFTFAFPNCWNSDATFCGFAAMEGWAYVDLGSVKCVRRIVIESRRRRLALPADLTFTSFVGVLISLRLSVVGTGAPMWSHTVTNEDVETGIATFVVPTTSIPSPWPANFSLVGFAVGKETLPQPHAGLGGGGHCITAQYLYIDGSEGASPRLDLREVEIRGPDGMLYTIVSGAMSSTRCIFHGDGSSLCWDITRCFDGRHDVSSRDREGGCQTAQVGPYWAYFDLGTPKCVGTIAIWNGFGYRTWPGNEQILGAVLSLRTTLSGAPLWSERVTLETCGVFFDSGGNPNHCCGATLTSWTQGNDAEISLITFPVESSAPLHLKEHVGDCYCESQRTSQCDYENALDDQRARLYAECANGAANQAAQPGGKCITWGERSVPYPQK